MRQALMRTSLLAVLSLCGCNMAEREEPDADPEPVKVERVPLKSMFVSFDQEGGPTIVESVKDKPFDGLVEDVGRQMRSGASNLFLVRGGDIEELVAGSRGVLVGGDTADRAVSARAKSSPKCWLVAFLGRGPSGPPVRDVRSVERRGAVVRLAVGRPKLHGGNKDKIPYLVWAPLGKLPAGTYTLELVNDGEKEPSLVRRVRVENK
jgi:hypothetical protein